jgi:hypothetical protein
MQRQKELTYLLIYKIPNMENLNEGKKKTSSYMNELAEIDKQSALVALEAKINKLAEMIETKNTRINLVSEDENLSELIDKKRVKEMQREIKEIERAKLKLEKLFEKQGGKMSGVIDEDARTDAEEEGYEDGIKDEKEDVEEGTDSTYEEDDNDSVNEDFDDVVDDIMDQGKSREDAENIAGAINRDHVGSYRQEESLSEFDLRGYLSENRLLKEGDITGENLANLMKTRGTADVSLWHIAKLIKAGIIQDSEKEKALKAVDYDF